MKEEKEADKESKENKPYEKPGIMTYTEDEILDLIGPANTAGSPFFCYVPGPGHGNGHVHGHRRH
jgi:hypothetical protein